MPDYTRSQVLEKLQHSFDKGQPLLAVGAGTGITAKFAEQGGADLIVIYNSGRYRMSGFGSCAGLLAYGDANAIVMEMGEREVLPVVKEVPVIAGVNGTDPTRRMRNFLKQVKDMGFDGANNFPTVGVIDGNFRLTLEETGLGFCKEIEMIDIAHNMDLFTIVYVFNPDEAKQMAEAGADVIIAHMGSTVGGVIGAETAPNLKDAAKCVQEICDAAFSINPSVICLSHGGPIATAPEAAYINQHTSTVGFVGASSIERFACESSIPQVTASFKKIPLS
jgi:predicted TIM-barrel enzyme